jgi:hypothetical protein
MASVAVAVVERAHSALQCQVNVTIRSARIIIKVALRRPQLLAWGPSARHQAMASVAVAVVERTHSAQQCLVNVTTRSARITIRVALRRPQLLAWGPSARRSKS